MYKDRKNRTFIIGALIFVLLLMAGAYAAFQTRLDVSGTSKVTSNWDVKITNISSGASTGSAENATTPTWTDLTAYMEANLYEKGDSMEYDVTISNRGTFDAKLDDIITTPSSNDAVLITYTGYTKGEMLPKGQDKVIHVKIAYNPSYKGGDATGISSVEFQYVQGEGSNITPDGPQYVLTYNCTTNGGIKGNAEDEKINEGATVSLTGKTCGQKLGYTFTGWNTSANASTTINEVTVDSNTTLYGLYTPNTYSISYSLNGGTHGTNHPNSGTYDSNVQISNPTKTITITGNANETGATVGANTTGNQTFTGWTSSTVGDYAKTGNTSTPTTKWTGTITQNTYFKNLKESGTVTLTANWGGGTITLPTATKTGYTCKWYTKATGGTEIGEGGDTWTIPTGNNTQTSITVYARCTANEYTVTADANGGTITSTSGWTGTGNTSTKSVTYNSAYGTLPVPVRTGYTFKGWNGKNLFNPDKMTFSSSTHTQNTEEISFKSGVYDRILDKQQWTPKENTTYTLAMDILENTYNLPMHLYADSRFYIQNYSNNEILAGKTGKHISTFKTREDFSEVTLGSFWFATNISVTGTFRTKLSIFEGTDINEYEPYYINDSTTVVENQNHTLKAIWEPNTFTIAYNANGGTGTTTSHTCTYNSPCSLANNSFSKAGYTFAGWKKNNEGNTLSEGSSIQNAATNGTVTYYAQWSPNIYTVTLNDENATTAGTTTIYEKYNTGYYLDNTGVTQMTTSSNGITIPEKTGYTFGGYYTQTNGNGTQYIDENGKLASSASTTNFSAAGTLYAKWTASTYTVTADANGGTIASTSGWTGTGNTSTKSVTYNSAYGTLPEPTRTGYTFNGWNGKNLLNYNILKRVQRSYYITVNENGQVSANPSDVDHRGWTYEENHGWTTYLEANTYTLSLNFSTLSTTGDNRIRVSGINNVEYCGGSLNNRSNYKCTFTITTPQNINSVVKGYNGVYKIQLEEGNTESEWEPYYVTSSTNVTQAKDHTLKAIWEQNTYTITLDNQSATTAGTTTIYEQYNTGYYLDNTGVTQMTTSSNGITIPEKTGYTFGGYYTQTNGNGTQYIDENGKLTSSASTTNFSAAGTLYAKWIPNTFTVSYNANGGTGTTASHNCTYDAACTLATNNFSKEGYAFAGWKKNNEGNTLAASSSIKNAATNGTVTYYAQWVDNENPTVSDIGGGSELKKASQTLTLKCDDNIGVTAYYWGTNEPTSATDITTTASLSDLTSSSGLNKTVSSQGTYYLGCKDAAGNFATKNIVIRRYRVQSVLEKINGVRETFNSDNYELVGSMETYYTREITTMTPSGMYTIPTGADASTFLGRTTLPPETGSFPPGMVYDQTVDGILLNDDKIYYMWFNRKTFTVNVKSGENETVTAETVTQTNNSTGTVTSNAPNGINLTVKYGDTVRATATPNTGYTFDGWSGGYLSGTTNPQIGSQVTSNKNIIGHVKMLPTISNISHTATTTSITVVTSANVGGDSSKITKYEYSIDDGTTWIDNGTNNTYTFDNLNKNTNYNIKVRVTSNENVDLTSNSISINTEALNAPTFTENISSTETIVTISYPEDCTTYTCTYQKNNGTIMTVTNDEADVAFAAAGSISASISDGDHIVTRTYSLEYNGLLPTSETFSDTSDVITWTAPATGEYYLQVWGAQGGTVNSKTGGKGGYSYGYITLIAGDTLYIHNGGQGSAGTGGANGGGAGVGTTSAGGGGGTDIRVGTDSLYARVIVAGGGAGAGQDSCATATNGYGGGETGGGGTSQSSCGTQAGAGTQTSGGVGGLYSSTRGASGTFGQGGNATNGSYDGGGGGGGWYGGGAGASAGYSNGGGGGSGYVYTEDTAVNYPEGCLLNSNYYLRDAATISGNIQFDSPTGAKETGHENNGYTKISYDIENGANSRIKLRINDVTTNSISVTASRDTNVNITKYEFSADNGATWINNGTTNTYTFTGLTHNTIYNLKVRGTTSTGKVVASIEGTTNTLTLPTFSDAVTTESINTTITYPSGCGNTLTCTYQKDGGPSQTVTNSTQVVSFTSTGTLIATVDDGTNTTSNTHTTTETISLSKSTSKTTNTITVTTYVNNSTGVTKYEFTKDNGTTWIDNGTSNTYTFDSLTHGTYPINVRVTTNFGTTKTSTVTNVTTNPITVPTYSQTDNDADDVDITITYPSGCGSIFTCTYIKDNGIPVPVTSSTIVVNFDTDGELSATVSDGQNSGSSAFTVLMPYAITNHGTSILTGISGNGELVEDPTEPGKYIYRGKNPYNYLTLGTDTYRIISFETDGTIKVFKNNNIGIKYWDPGYYETISGITSSGSTNGTRYSSNANDFCKPTSSLQYFWGCKTWGSSTTTLDASGNSVTAMKKEIGGSAYNLPDSDSYLNVYLNGGSYTGHDIAGWIDDLSYKSLIVTHSFDVGPIQSISGQTLATDVSQAHAYTWQGKVGLLTATEYVKTNSNTATCGTIYLNAGVNNYSTCIKTTYITYSSYSYWTMSPKDGAHASIVWYVGSNSKLLSTSYSTTSGAYMYYVHPTFYISSNTQLTGSGTSDAPYTVVS